IRIKLEPQITLHFFPILLASLCLCVMEQSENSTIYVHQQHQEPEEEPNQAHQFTLPPGLTPEESDELKSGVTEFHSYRVNSSQCSSLLAQRIHAPPHVVWSVVRRFEKPQIYKY
ncbi:hypothetical protein AABB24_031265, partial [Solanum stoloniferum]